MSVFIPSKYQSKMSFWYKMTQYPKLHFSSFLRKPDKPKQTNFFYIWCLFVLETFVPTATGWIFPSRRQSTGFKFWIVLKWEILISIAFCGNLIGWNFQNLHGMCFLRFQLMCPQNYRLDFFYQGLSGQFHLCIRLLDNQILKYFPCLRTLIGWIWQKCDL